MHRMEAVEDVGAELGDARQRLPIAADLVNSFVEQLNSLIVHW
ncbi:hypothetical protein ACWCYY_31650 [Kitasatospora sp. NPDC001664]